MRWASRSVTEALGGASLLNHVEVIPHNKHGPEQRKLSLSPCMTYIVNLLDDYTQVFFFRICFGLGYRSSGGRASGFQDFFGRREALIFTWDEYNKRQNASK